MSPKMVLLLAECRIPAAQIQDIRKRLRDKKIPYHVVRISTRVLEVPVTDTYIFVAEADLTKAQTVVRGELRMFASERRREWEKKWRERYGGSYWKWLTHHGYGSAKLALIKFVYLMG